MIGKKAFQTLNSFHIKDYLKNFFAEFKEAFDIYATESNLHNPEILLRYPQMLVTPVMTLQQCTHNLYKW